MERMAKETLMKPTQVTSALTIPTPAGNAIVSLTTTQTTPTTSITTCALSLSEEQIRTLREVAQQNDQLPQQLSRVFPKAVRPLLDVHSTAAQKALSSNSTALGPISGSASGPSTGPAKVPRPSSGPAKGSHVSAERNRRLPQGTQPSPIGTSTDNSGSAYLTPKASMDSIGMFEVDKDMLGDAKQRVKQRGLREPLVVKIRSGQGSVASVSSAPSPAISRGKDMLVLKAAAEQEIEEERRAKAEKNKAGKRKAATPSSSSCSFSTSSSEEEEPAEKIKAMKKGKQTTQKAPVKVPSKMPTKAKGKRSLEEPTQ